MVSVPGPETELFDGTFTFYTKAIRAGCLKRKAQTNAGSPLHSQFDLMLSQQHSTSNVIVHRRTCLQVFALHRAHLFPPCYWSVMAFSLFMAAKPKF